MWLIDGLRTLTCVSARRDAERSSLWIGPAPEFRHRSQSQPHSVSRRQLEEQWRGCASPVRGIWNLACGGLISSHQPLLPSPVSSDTSTSCHVSFCRKSPISGQRQATPGHSQSPCRPELFVLRGVRWAEDDDSHMTRLIRLSASLVPCGLGVGAEALPAHTVVFREHSSGQLPCLLFGVYFFTSPHP